MIENATRSTEIMDDQNKDRHRHYDYSGWIRRIDLSLRARYPQLVTRIFEIAPNQYVIWFRRELLDAKSIQNIFSNEIRFLTTNAVVSNDIPKEFSREIQPMADEDIARGYAGMPMSLPEVGNLIAARFPNLPIIAVRDGGNPMMITVDLSSKIGAADEKTLLKFCHDLEAIVPWQINVLPPNQIPQIKADPIIQVSGTHMSDALAVRATRRRPYLPVYSKHDEAFWFENIDNIFAGKIPVKSIPGVVQNQSQCYMDLTVGDHINLRQTLMLYDTIYISPPLQDGHDLFLKKQQISEADLLTLIEQGRLKIVSTQPEERLNLNFLAAASERHDTAIIGRRSTAALLISDIVQTANDYWLTQSDTHQRVMDLAKFLSEKVNIPIDESMRLLLWPVEARRTVLQPLLERGSKGIAPISLASLISRQIKRQTNKDFELETLVISEKVHIGHALNATVFPGKDEPAAMILLMNIMADRLNFYRSFNNRMATSWIANENRKADNKPVMPALPLFEFDSNVPMNEFLETINLASTRGNGKALFGRLANLPENQREMEITRLDAELRKRLKASGSLISFANLDTLISIGALFTGAPYPPIAGIRTLGAQLTETFRKNPTLDRLIDGVERSFGKNQEIDFLSRINRVASFKKDRIS